MTIPALPGGITLPAALALPSLERQVIDFLGGRSNGAELMLVLYGDVAEEPLPPRLADLARRWGVT